MRLSATFTPDVSGAWQLGLESAGRSVLRLDGSIVLDNTDPAGELPEDCVDQALPGSEPDPTTPSDRAPAIADNPRYQAVAGAAATPSPDPFP